MHVKSTKKDDAVSPVVGVMLMVVVTVIIAAIVAASASGLIGGVSKTPSASFDVSATDDSLTIKTLSVSDPINTKDLRVVVTKKGAEIADIAANLSLGDGDGAKAGLYGLGTGIEGKGFHTYGGTAAISDAGHDDNKGQWFGRYFLYAGTTMTASDDALDKISKPFPPNGLKSQYTTAEFMTLDAETWNIIVAEVTNTEPSDSALSAISMKVKDNMVSDYGTYPNGDTIVANQYIVPNDGWQLIRNSGATYISEDGSWNVESNDAITVSIIYVPSGQIISKTEVTVM